MTPDPLLFVQKWYCKKCKKYLYGWGVGGNCPDCGGVLVKAEEEKENDF